MFRLLTSVVVFALGAIGSLPVLKAGDPPSKGDPAHFWSFLPPVRQSPPAVKHRERVWTGIDAYLLKPLEEAGLEPASAADRRTWIRRASFDLTGLPPRPEEVAAFLADEAPGSEERLVGRLLASPQFGVRWARLWLDLSRYAEDQAHIVGNNTELCYPNAPLYRDWVIVAINQDLPYNEFVKRQLATDLMEPERREEFVALGFMGLGPKYYRRGDAAVMADEWEDRVDTLCRGLLGLTVACARCHDHKFDPVPTADYYSLAGVFASTSMFNAPIDPGLKPKDGKLKPEQAIHIVREEKPVQLAIQIRGDVASKGEVVPRRFLRLLSPGGEAPTFTAENSGRLDLAEAIVSRRNPLTARVFVNRVWAVMFGRALVGTPSNFGTLGEAPTHPALLDDLAVRFMDNGWSLKWLVREIALSSSYRQSCDGDPATHAADPANLLYGHMNRRRLPVEGLRDAMLSAAGSLDETLGGPSFEASDPEMTRRTVYARISRLQVDPLLSIFDFPDPNLHSEKRNETTTPLQKLFLLNSPFMIRQADALADRLARETGGAPDEVRIRRAYELVYARPVSAAELAIGRDFLTQATSDGKSPWQQYAQILLSANEMQYLD